MSANVDARPAASIRHDNSFSSSVSGADGIHSQRIPSLLMDSWEFRKIMREGSVLPSAFCSCDVFDDGCDCFFVGTSEGLLCAMQTNRREPIYFRTLASTISVVLYSKLTHSLVTISLEGVCEVVDHFLDACEAQQANWRASTQSVSPDACVRSFSVAINCCCGDFLHPTEIYPNRMALGSWDQRVYVYDLQTGQCLLKLYCHHPVTGIKAFTIAKPTASPSRPSTASTAASESIPLFVVATNRTLCLLSASAEEHSRWLSGLRRGGQLTLLDPEGLLEIPGSPVRTTSLAYPILQGKTASRTHRLQHINRETGLVRPIWLVSLPVNGPLVAPSLYDLDAPGRDTDGDHGDGSATLHVSPSSEIPGIKESYSSSSTVVSESSESVEGSNNRPALSMASSTTGSRSTSHESKSIAAESDEPCNGKATYPPTAVMSALQQSSEHVSLENGSYLSGGSRAKSVGTPHPTTKRSEMHFGVPLPVAVDVGVGEKKLEILAVQEGGRAFLIHVDILPGHDGDRIPQPSLAPTIMEPRGSEVTIPLYSLQSSPTGSFLLTASESTVNPSGRGRPTGPSQRTSSVSLATAFAPQLPVAQLRFSCAWKADFHSPLVRQAYVVPCAGGRFFAALVTSKGRCFVMDTETCAVMDCEVMPGCCSFTLTSAHQQSMRDPHHYIRSQSSSVVPMVCCCTNVDAITVYTLGKAREEIYNGTLRTAQEAAAAGESGSSAGALLSPIGSASPDTDQMKEEEALREKLLQLGASILRALPDTDRLKRVQYTSEEQIQLARRVVASGYSAEEWDLLERLATDL